MVPGVVVTGVVVVLPGVVVTGVVVPGVMPGVVPGVVPGVIPGVVPGMAIDVGPGGVTGTGMVLSPPPQAVRAAANTINKLGSWSELFIIFLFARRKFSFVK